MYFTALVGRVKGVLVCPPDVYNTFQCTYLYLNACRKQPEQRLAYFLNFPLLVLNRCSFHHASVPTCCSLRCFLSFLKTPFLSVTTKPLLGFIASPALATPWPVLLNPSHRCGQINGQKKLLPEESLGAAALQDFSESSPLLSLGESPWHTPLRADTPQIMLKANYTSKN